MENEKQIPYPIENRYNIKSILYFILAVSLISIGGFTFRYGIGGFVLNIFGVVVAILIFTNIRTKVYVIDCPYCKQETDFPVNAQGQECSCCQKRIILINGQFCKVDE